MKAEIVKRPQADCINIIPESEEELIELRKLWNDDNIQLMKVGCVLHGDKKTEHSVANFYFSILIRRI